MNDKNKIDILVETFFSVFTNKESRTKIETLKHLCIPEIIIIRKTNEMHDVYNLENFITPRIKLLTNGKLLDFEEVETSETTTIRNYVAQRTSEYRKEGILDGNRFCETGTKMFQFLKIEGQWKISSLIWNDY